MADVFQRVRIVHLGLTIMDKDVSGTQVALMEKCGMRLFLNVSVPKVLFGMAMNVLDAEEDKYIKAQVVSVLKVCSGMVKNVLLLILDHVEELIIADGIMENVIVNLVSIKKVVHVFVLDWLTIINAIDATQSLILSGGLVFVSVYKDFMNLKGIAEDTEGLCHQVDLEGLEDQEDLADPTQMDAVSPAIMIIKSKDASPVLTAVFLVYLVMSALNADPVTLTTNFPKDAWKIVEMV